MAVKSWRSLLVATRGGRAAAFLLVLAALALASQASSRDSDVIRSTPKKNVGLLLRAREHRWFPQGGRYGKRSDFPPSSSFLGNLDNLDFGPPLQAFHTDNVLCTPVGIGSLFRCLPKRGIYGVRR